MISRLSELASAIKKRLKPGTSPGQPASLLDHVDPNELLEPAELIRLGTTYGGWFIPRDAKLNSDSICYLAGAGEDISFDCALVQLFGCHVRVVDPTPRAVRHFEELSAATRSGQRYPVNHSATDYYDITAAQLERLSFLPLGLADQDIEMKFYLPKNPDHVSCSTVNLQKTEDFFVAQCHRLATIMAQQGDSRLDLLKMDIEGAEYSVIRDMVKTNLLPRILLIEFDEMHSPQDAGAGARVAEHIRLLRQAGMRCVAAEGSNLVLVREAE